MFLLSILLIFLLILLSMLFLVLLFSQECEFLFTFNLCYTLSRAFLLSAVRRGLCLRARSRHGGRCGRLLFGLVLCARERHRDGLRDRPVLPDAQCDVCLRPGFVLPRTLDCAGQLPGRILLLWWQSNAVRGRTPVPGRHSGHRQGSRLYAGRQKHRRVSHRRTRCVRVRLAKFSHMSVFHSAVLFHVEVLVPLCFLTVFSQEPRRL